MGVKIAPDRWQLSRTIAIDYGHTHLWAGALARPRFPPFPALPFVSVVCSLYLAHWSGSSSLSSLLSFCPQQLHLTGSLSALDAWCFLDFAGIVFFLAGMRARWWG